MLEVVDSKVVFLPRETQAYRVTEIQIWLTKHVPIGC